MRRKPFNLEEAKAGKPVCTREGKDVRIICFDRKSLSGIPIVALVLVGNYETVFGYDEKGREHCGFESLDLFMKEEEHTGYVFEKNIMSEHEAIIKMAEKLHENPFNPKWLKIRKIKY